MNNELVEQQLDTTEKRLDDHAERIRKLESVTAVMDNRLAALYTALEHTNSTIKALVTTIITALIGFFFYAVQTGLFN